MSNGFVLSSPAFEPGQPIPQRHSCQGEDLSPPLHWSGAPDDTGAFALVVLDRDAHDFVHWVVADIPAETTEFGQGIPLGGPGGAVEGRNDFGRTGWGGPCPPPGSGDHHYVFTLFALPAPLALGDGASADQVLAAAEEKALGKATLEGTYRR